MKILDKLFYLYHRHTIWKRFGFRRCEVCKKLTFIQREVGVGYWVCNKEECTEAAHQMNLLDIEAWQEMQRKADEEQGYITRDSSEKNIIEYE